MEYTEFKHLLDFIRDSLADEEGYTIVVLKKDADPGAEMFHFDTRDELNANFRIGGAIYPIIVPQHIVEDHDNFVTCMIDGNEYDLELYEIYLFVNGHLIRRRRQNQ
jgi:hypothetical protein